MSIKTIVKGAGVLALAIALQPHTAWASSTAASTGNANSAGSNTCFSSGAGSVTNLCSGVHNWEIPMVVSVAGTYNVTVNVSSFMTCGAFGSTQGGTIWSGSNVSGTGNIPINGIVVPANGTLNAYCQVPQNGRVNSVNW